MKYKVGDKVRIKSLDWYNENKDNNREIRFENGIFTTLKSTYLGQIMTIEEITLEKQYILMEDRYKTLWTDEMIEGLVEEEMSLDKAGQITDFEYDGLAYTLPEGYIFKDENGNVINATKIVLEKKKKEYPKTYEECCYVLGFENTEMVFEDDYRDINLPKEQWKRLGLMNQLNKLLICRDAYWKIAGEEMGLGKPWEPDWKDGDTHKFVIHVIKDEIRCGVGLVRSDLLSFPTEEMRDAFKENFDPDIDTCKKLL